MLSSCERIQSQIEIWQTIIDSSFIWQTVHIQMQVLFPAFFRQSFYDRYVTSIYFQKLICANLNTKFDDSITF